MFTTLTIDPRGRVGCAAVSAYMSYVSPLAVGCPSKSSPYQLVVHSQTARGFVRPAADLVLIVEGESFSTLIGRGLPGFPVAVGFAVGINTSIPNPKNTVCNAKNTFAFMVS